MIDDTGDDSSLDTILAEVGGFGLFQFITYILICIPNILSATTYVNYMISANVVDYRCKVPECEFGENNRDIQYQNEWIQFAIPYSNGKIDKCFRYAPKNMTTTETYQCNAVMFDISTKIECTEYIYASDEKNVQTEFNIHCSDNYKLALVGTINNFGRFLFLPLTGLLSDRFGRLKVVVNGLFLCCIFGIIKSFSISYLMYLALEFLESSAGTSTFGGVYVLGIESVGSKYRILSSTITSLAHPIGEIIFGFVAMYIHNFRYLIRIFYIPGLFVFALFWLVPESIRWLLVTGRVDRAVKILKRIARVNGKELSEKSIDTLKLKYSPESIAINSSTEKGRNTKKPTLVQSFWSIFTSKTLCLRFFICCYQWMACCFSYFGLSLSATQIPGANRYTSFIFVTAVEIPGLLLQPVLLNRMKRRIVLFSALTISSIAIVTTSFIPEEHSTIVLILFMLGKASMTFAFAILYIFTAEQWPTQLRTSIMNSCSMIGRIGSMVAPLTVILGAQYGSLPALLFGITSLIAAISVLFNPETYLKKLPDTMDEAKYL